MSSMSASSRCFEEFEEEADEGPHLPYYNNHKNKTDILRWTLDDLNLSEIN
jgi:hypothetical protein